MEIPENFLAKESLIPCITHYSPLEEAAMKTLYDQLSEKDRRLYAGTEAMKLPHGGITYVADLFECDRKTVNRGMFELNNPEQIEKDRTRKKGGGRKTSLEAIPDIDEKFIKVIWNYTAGDPMDEKIRQTNLTCLQIADRLKAEGVEVSKKIVKKLFKKHGYVKRKAQKVISTVTCKGRNEQFENIAALIAKYKVAGNPVISIDTKKKEMLGNLYRDGAVYTLVVQKVLDHDFPHLADGIVIPHGIYDVIKNTAYVNIGTSKDTSEFSCDSIRAWWHNEGICSYSGAASILILCDAGGGNSYRHYIFKEDLQKPADEIGVEIRIAHYPSYASKWNPIEHRLFCHITRALKGVIFKSYELVKELIESATTKTGLTVKANIIKKVYETGRKYAENFKETMRIKSDEVLGKWNYRAISLQK